MTKNGRKNNEIPEKNNHLWLMMGLTWAGLIEKMRDMVICRNCDMLVNTMVSENAFNHLLAYVFFAIFLCAWDHLLNKGVEIKA